jgi:uncharacterized protein (DUF58 family)
MSVAQLFPPDFLSAIASLRLLSRAPRRSANRGEHVSRQPGVGLDFRDFRSYTPGDDFRRIDWNVYRRSQRLVTRVYDAPRRLPLSILLDVSRSMFFDDPPRAAAGRRVAAALASAALTSHNPVQVVPFDERARRPLRCANRAAFPKLLSELAVLTAGGRTDLPSAIEAYRRTRRQPGLLAVITDFFQPDGVTAALAALARLNERLVLVQLIHGSDDVAADDRELELVDCESEARLRVQVDQAVIQRYEAARAALHAQLTAFAHARSVPYVTLAAERAVLPQLTPLVTAGLLRNG